MKTKTKVKLVSFDANTRIRVSYPHYIEPLEFFERMTKSNTNQVDLFQMVDIFLKEYSAMFIHMDSSGDIVFSEYFFGQKTTPIGVVYADSKEATTEDFEELENLLKAS